MLKKFNYVRVAAAVPDTNPCDVDKNVDNIMTLLLESENNSTDIIIFPELSITSYTCADLFRQNELIVHAMDGLLKILKATKKMDIVCVIGIPLVNDNLLFNTAVCLQRGEILGIVPKTYIPGTKEYYEKRWFASSFDIRRDKIDLFGKTIPFKKELIFKSSDKRGFTLAIEICEDLWAVTPPSAQHSLHGAEIIVNLSASNELTGKADYRKSLVVNQSARILGGYAYTSAGVGESTTDTIFGGHSIIAENGKILAENKRFLRNNAVIYSDIDLDIIRHERKNSSAFQRIPGSYSEKNEYTFITVRSDSKKYPVDILRKIELHPFVPAEKENREKRCEEILSIQSIGLATRLKHTGIEDTIIGLSGGLDSTLALLVIIEAYNHLHLNKNRIHCLTLPGFGTTKQTRGNVEKLCRELGLQLETINISSAAQQHLKDIGHDGIRTDITYENTQARERTQILMDRANMENGLVIGTGDLSELALGWCTYNGDHMSMYTVNSGVPKTLVSYLIEYYADYRSTTASAKILKNILATPISPELLPPGKNGQITQITEDKIGPYELHDFFLFHVVRFGYAPKKILFLSVNAFDGIYSPASIKKWLIVFYKRFFSQQFKRSAIPDGPKVGTIALSPRADWRMPSDASPEVWLKALE